MSDILRKAHLKIRKEGKHSFVRQNFGANLLSSTYLS